MFFFMAVAFNRFYFDGIEIKNNNEDMEINWLW